MVGSSQGAVSLSKYNSYRYDKRVLKFAKESRSTVVVGERPFPMVNFVDQGDRSSEYFFTF
jgi:hypothetical protein